VKLAMKLLFISCVDSIATSAMESISPALEAVLTLFTSLETFFGSNIPARVTAVSESISAE